MSAVLLEGTANFIRNVSPAFRTTLVVVTTQLLATPDGVEGADVPQDNVNNGHKNHCRLNFDISELNTVGRNDIDQELMVQLWRPQQVFAIDCSLCSGLLEAAYR